jgi:hypothetical protein
MANGDFCVNGMDQHRWAIKLLDGQVNDGSGPWCEVPAWFNIRSFWTDLTAEGGGTPKIDIMVCNAATQPASATDDAIARTLNVATPVGTGTEAYRWVKAKKTKGTTGAATMCILEAARNE